MPKQEAGSRLEDLHDIEKLIGHTENTTGVDRIAYSLGLVARELWMIANNVEKKEED